MDDILFKRLLLQSAVTFVQTQKNPSRQKAMMPPPTTPAHDHRYIYCQLLRDMFKRLRSSNTLEMGCIRQNIFLMIFQLQQLGAESL